MAALFIYTDMLLGEILVKRGGATREQLSETAKNKELSDAALEDRIKGNHEKRRELEKVIAGLQKQLAEAVNNRQEIELMLQGILK